MSMFLFLLVPMLIGDVAYFVLKRPSTMNGAMKQSAVNWK